VEKEEDMRRVSLFGVAIVLLAMAGTAMAAGSVNLTVQASVIGTCKFTTGDPTLDFGALDPAAGGNVNASTAKTFWCTKGVTTDAIAAGNGANWSGSSRQMLDAVSGDLIPYSLTLTKDANLNTGPATPRTLTIAGSILGADYTGKSAGSYSDTVVLTITP
jgi:spore coat protein U-like protein